MRGRLKNKIFINPSKFLFPPCRRRGSPDGIAFTLPYITAIQCIKNEIENLFNNLFIWSPVLIGTGIGFFFAQPSEPTWTFLLSLVSVAFLFVALFIFLDQWWGMLAVTLLGLIIIGMVAAKFRLTAVEAPRLSEKIGPLFVIGQITKIENRGSRGIRFHLHLKGTRPSGRKSLRRLETWPHYIRISARPEVLPPRKNLTDRDIVGPPVIGQFVELEAVLFPPPKPVLPGGYDFSRTAYFQQLGAVGYALTPPRPMVSKRSRQELVSPAAKQEWSKPAALVRSFDQNSVVENTDLYKIFMSIEKLRQSLSLRIRSALPSRSGGLADALITGNRSGLDEPEISHLRMAGLAHILAISGLHMAIMAGTLFWWLRAVLALVPPLALYIEIKKTAAIFSLFGAAFYLLLSGASVATERAFIMMAILFVGIIVDRPGITLRNVAAAALIILLSKPESLVDVGFQMSFAAVTALVSVFEFFRKKSIFSGKVFGPGILSSLLSYFLGITASTLIASLAVAPLAVFHFHKLTQYGLAANLIVLPLLGLLIMPAALATLVLLPVGLEAIPLTVMGVGCDWVLEVARIVSSWTNAQITIAQWSNTALLIIVAGSIWLMLCQTAVRLLGLPLLVAGLYIAAQTDDVNRPEILIERNGQIAAVRDSRGRLVIPALDRGGYALKKWLEADGDTRTLAEVANATLFPCNRNKCWAEIGDLRLVLVRSRRGLHKVCDTSDIVIVPFTVSIPCASALLIDGRALQRDGAHAIYVEQHNEAETKIFSRNNTSYESKRNKEQPGSQSKTRLKILTVRQLQGDWPWSR